MKGFCWTLTVFLITLISQPGGAMDFSVGVSKVDITPPIEMKASLGGYGERMNQPATGVHDRLMAKGLYLVGGEKRYCLVTCDALGFPPALKPAVLKKLTDSGWKSEEILLLPSHSHTSFDMTAINPDNTFGIPQLGIYQPELFEYVVDKLAETVKKASLHPVPAVFGVASRTLEGWAANRRDGQSEKDEVLTVARFDTQAGKPLAALVHWAAHPTFMDSTEMMFSGGWPGHLQRTMEAILGEGVEVLYCNGAQGDQRPEARPDSGYSNWEKAERYGRELGIVTADLWETVETKPVEVFDFNQETLALPPRTWHKDFMETGGAEYGMRPEIMEMLIQQMVPESSFTGCVRIDDFVMAGVPGELASALGKEVKQEISKRTGAAQVVIGGLANEWISYILSPEEYTRGGYEASVSFYGPQLGPTILKAVIQAAGSLN